jgi:hypothetical protein
MGPANRWKPLLLALAMLGFSDSLPRSVETCVLALDRGDHLEDLQQHEDRRRIGT